MAIQLRIEANDKYNKCAAAAAEDQSNGEMFGWSALSRAIFIDFVGCQLERMASSGCARRRDARRLEAIEKKKKNCKADGNESRAHGVRTSNVQLT